MGVPAALAVIIVVGQFLYFRIFDGPEDFQRSLRYLGKWDLKSLYDGDYLEDRFATLKFNFWLFGTGLAGYLAYIFAERLG